jgi:hypothetical protein
MEEVEINPIEMEVETKPFPLLLLPSDVLDFIAHFLPFNDTESEQEFIERTKTKKEVPQKCVEHLPKFECGYGLRTISVYCPYNKFIALQFEQYSEIHKSSTLIIINGDNNQAVYTTEIKQYTSSIALSHKEMFAIIYSEKDLSRGQFTEVIHYKDVLSIKNIKSQKEESHTIPENFSITNNNVKYPTIAFNKQGTQIILRGYDQMQASSNPLDSQNNVHYKIFPITINTPNQNADNKKTLEKYFKQQGICKEIIKQITLNK